MTVELTDTAEPTPQSRNFATLYAEAQEFYARQMRILDAYESDTWADTFTEDAVLELPSGPEPVRAGLVRPVRAGAARQRRAGRRLDHWVGLLDVRPQPDGALHTRCSALAHGTSDEDGSRVLYVCLMEDVLVRTCDGWRTAHRRVVRDDLA